MSGTFERLARRSVQLGSTGRASDYGGPWRMNRKNDLPQSDPQIIPGSGNRPPPDGPPLDLEATNLWCEIVSRCLEVGKWTVAINELRTIRTGNQPNRTVVEDGPPLKGEALRMIVEIVRLHLRAGSVQGAMQSLLKRRDDEDMKHAAVGPDDPVAQLGLESRTLNLLDGLGVFKIRHLVKAAETWAMNVPLSLPRQLGSGQYMEICQSLANAGLIGQDAERWMQNTGRNPKTPTR